MSAVCPYCRCPLLPDEAQVVCPSCQTPHHADCYQENGGCTVFGCPQAPSDEPGVRVSAGEVGVVGATAPAAAAAQAATAPPPLVSSAAPPPPRPGEAAPAVTAAPAAVSPPLTFAEAYAGVEQRKKRTTFVLLGIFLGALGGHNFYAGYYRKGAAQLCLSLFTLFYAALVSEIWAIVEVCTVVRDGDGQEFQ